MAGKASDILGEIIKLANSLPADPADYAELSANKRRGIRLELERVVHHLNTVAQSLNNVRQPKHVFDPTSPKIIGDMVAHALLLQDREFLAESSKLPFYGAGVYAIYYRGGFEAYAPISGRDHPIYVGKADPEALHALTPQDQGSRLFIRLKDHQRSINSAENLELEDFECRYLVVRSAWVETAEDLLIDWFKPVWNNEMKICYGFGKHGDSAKTRLNERSPWDTIHPGRAWATSGENTPNKRSAQEIIGDIAAHYAKFPPNS
jgi:hypothetical protein